MSEVALLGIHHVTAICGHPQRTREFYEKVLGLRLVKRTVNFDDPGTWHLYFGTERGAPGTIITFFPWMGAPHGRVGAGQCALIALAVPPESIGWWIERFLTHGVTHGLPATRHGERVLEFRDPDGMLLELVSTPEVDERAPWTGGGVPADVAIRGVHAVTCWVESARDTRALITEELGFVAMSQDGNHHRFTCNTPRSGTYLDLRVVGGFIRGVEGVGTVHHVAWRVADDKAQHALRERIADAGHSITGQLDRRYFRSMYFREPGGTLFELATDQPGFTLDEPLETLGEALALPPWLEPARPAITRSLAPIDDEGLPGVSAFEAAPASFVHRFVPPERDQAGTLLLLHGTGGDENDLLPLGPMIAPGWALLSPRGPVLEHGMPRFFRRVSEGVFDLADLTARTDELAAFVGEAARAYGFDQGRVVAGGFSNGANIAASVLLRHPGTLRGAMLFAPMLPFEPAELPDLRGTYVFVGAGRRDAVAPPAQVERLVALLRQAGADVTVEWHEGGHELNAALARAAKGWFGKRFA
ncbi:MAG: VOC family protein [Gemmatimonadetes bacterium]|nr:VOC family protein [Gemmatimonadota bacterium]